jgi:hypothetical protein
MVLMGNHTFQAAVCSGIFGDKNAWYQNKIVYSLLVYYSRNDSYIFLHYLLLLPMFRDSKCGTYDIMKSDKTKAKYSN